MFGISVHTVTAGCGDNRDKSRFVEQGASTIWGSHYKNKYKASNLKVLPEEIPGTWAHFTAR